MQNPGTAENTGGGGTDGGNARTIELRLTLNTTDRVHPGGVFEVIKDFLESSGYGEVVEGRAVVVEHA
jgi:hypothetical protein